jgi:hypothetical protein
MKLLRCSTDHGSQYLPHSKKKEGKGEAKTNYKKRKIRSRKNKLVNKDDAYNCWKLQPFSLSY